MKSCVMSGFKILFEIFSYLLRLLCAEIFILKFHVVVLWILRVCQVSGANLSKEQTISIFSAVNKSVSVMEY